MISKSRLQKMIATLDKRKAEVAAVRDKIDDAISDFEQLKDDCTEAWEDLQRARDALSRLV